MPVSDLDLLIDAAKAASRIALHYWRSDQKVVDKPDGAGPVSEGDLAVDTALKEQLTQARPGYGWLSEETEDTPARLSQERVFIVDPIDGTRSYVDGQETWAHSLAVVENGQPTAAVVYLPARDKLYAAALGQGATLNGQAISCGTRRQADGASILVPKGNLDPQHWRGGVPSFERHFRPSLAYRLCLIADGRFDVMLTLRDAWEWDIAGGALIAAEAGAQITDRLGAPLMFNSERAKTIGVLTSNATLHTEVLARL